MSDEPEAESAEYEVEQRPEYEDIFEISGLEKHFNAAAWWGSDGRVILLARYTLQAAPEGEPDKGAMVALSTSLEEVRTDLSKVLSRKEVWNPQNKEEFLEDPRAIVLSDGRVLIALTNVKKTPEGDYLPYPALLYLKSKDEIPEIIQPDRVVEEFGPGKNFTPVDSETFLLRQEGPKNNHKLLVIKWVEQEKKLSQDGVLEFPADLEWANYRVGTTMPPIWVNDTEALWVFHGIQKVAEKYVYSLGVAKLEKDPNGKLTLRKENVYRSPILQPDNLVRGDKALAPELHPIRRVVYACGGVMEQVEGREKLILFVNAGDSKTVGVKYDKEALMSHFAWKS